MKKKKNSVNPMFTAIRKAHIGLYRRWYAMHQRCYNRQLKAYKDVNVHKEFHGHQGFVNFYDHMGAPPTPLHEMDRINPFGHYEPGNLRWVTRTVNLNNMRVHHKGNGRLKQLAIENGINTRTYYKRVREGWKIEDAATLPVTAGWYKHRKVK